MRLTVLRSSVSLVRKSSAIDERRLASLNVRRRWISASRWPESFWTKSLRWRVRVARRSLASCARLASSSVRRFASACVVERSSDLANSGLASSRESLEAERRSALDALEQALLKTGPDTVHPDALAWLGRTIRYLPVPVAAEIIPLQQRLAVAAEQEERLREQRRIVRERTQALQLSREMEQQHRKVQERQQREQQVRSRNAEELLAKADRLAAKGDFDQALELVAQAQALSPPQLEQIAMIREQLLATKAQRERETQAAELDGLFRRAKTAFDAGRYEEAVALFEQVIAQEASTGQSASIRQMAETAARSAGP